VVRPLIHPIVSKDCFRVAIWVGSLNHIPAVSKLQVECLQSLRTSDYDSYKETITPRVEGTCMWFLRHPKYVMWLKEEKSSLLWLSGDPGCGKTVLSSFLVDELRSTRSQAEFPATFCFFFCDDKIESQKDATAVLCGLLHQIFCANRSLIRHGTHHFEAKGFRVSKETKTLWDILKAASTDPEAGNIVCVIDALDECEETSRRLLIKWFVNYLTETGSPSRPFFKVIMTSRGYPSVESAFYSVPQVRLKAEDMSESINLDVARVIGTRSSQVKALTGCSEETRVKIAQRLVENADRTFLWVSLILEMLEDSAEASEEAFDRMTSTMPKRLDEVYETILQEISAHEGAAKAVALLVSAVRPLSLTELNMAFHICETDKSRNDVERRLEPAMDRTIRRLYGPLIRVIDSKVYLVHQTAKEFLIKRSERLNFLPDSYAAKYWAVHFRLSKTQGELALLNSVLDICDVRSGRFSTWFHVYWITIAQLPAIPQNLTTLMVASHFGHGPVVRLLLEKGTDVNAQDSE
jgi:hypothetical protein